MGRLCRCKTGVWISPLRVGKGLVGTDETIIQVHACRLRTRPDFPRSLANTRSVDVAVLGTHRPQHLCWEPKSCWRKSGRTARAVRRLRTNAICEQCRENTKREIRYTTRKLLSCEQGFNSPQLKLGPCHGSQIINTKRSFTVYTGVMYVVSKRGKKRSLFPLPTALTCLI